MQSCSPLGKSAYLPRLASRHLSAQYTHLQIWFLFDSRIFFLFFLSLYNTTCPHLFWKIFVDVLTSTLLHAQNTTLLSKVRWRFFQILWPSQKTQTLTDITHYWIFGCPSTYWYHQFGGCANHLFSMLCFCRISWQTLQPKTLSYLLYLAKGSLSHRKRQTGSNAGQEANCITLRLPP